MSAGEGNRNIAGRMQDYFERQIAHFEEIVSGLARAADDIEAGRFDEAAAVQESNQKKTESLAAEFWSLKREWDTAGDVAPRDREVVQGLARRADELSQQIRAALDASIGLSEAQRATLDASMKDIRQGKEFLGKYGTPRSNDPNIMDRKA